MRLQRLMHAAGLRGISRAKSPWRIIDDFSIAVAAYVDWLNHRWLHGEIGLIPPAEYEVNHYRHDPATTRSES